MPRHFQKMSPDPQPDRIAFRGACQGIEDAAALGVIFSSKYNNYTQNIEEGLKMYEKIRKPRAERVQHRSYLATEDIRERIGFSSLVSTSSRFRPATVLVRVQVLTTHSARVQDPSRGQAGQGPRPADD